MIYNVLTESLDVRSQPLSAFDHLGVHIDRQPLFVLVFLEQPLVDLFDAHFLDLCPQLVSQAWNFICKGQRGVGRVVPPIAHNLLLESDFLGTPL